MAALIRFLHGPYGRMATSVGALLEGEPCLAAVLDRTGFAYEMLWTGGRDGANKFLGGQTCSGEPTFQAPAGAQVFDLLNQYLWVSNGWSGGYPADGIDSPQEGMISASNFLGWSAFCPCIISLPASSGSFGSGVGVTGGGNLVITSCCPSGSALTKYLALSNACNPSLDGTYQLTWDSTELWWATSQIMNAWESYPVPVPNFFLFRCTDNTWELCMCINKATPSWGGINAVYQASAATCSPFDVSGSGDAVAGSLGSLCTGTGFSLDWSVTD